MQASPAPCALFSFYPTSDPQIQVCSTDSGEIHAKIFLYPASPNCEVCGPTIRNNALHPISPKLENLTAAKAWVTANLIPS